MLRTYCMTLLAGICLITLAPAQGLSDLRSDLKKAQNTNDGIRALESLAKLYVPGADNAAKVTDAVGEALKSSDYGVRSWALDLLQDRLDPVRSMAVLNKASVALRKEWEALEKAAKKSKPAKKAARKPERSAGNPLEGVMLLLEVRHEIEKALTVRVDYRARFVEVLSARTEDSVVDALDEVLQTVQGGGHADPILAELLRRATPEALSVVLGSFKSIETHIAERAKARSKFSRTKIEKQPKYWKGTPSAWETRQLSLRNSSLAAFAEYDRKLQIWMKTFHKRMLAFAQVKSLPAPPKSLLPARAWTKWRKAAIKLL